MGEVIYEFQPAIHITRFKWEISKEDADKVGRGTTLNSNEFILNESDMKVALQLVYQETSTVLLQIILKDRGNAEISNIRCNMWIVKTDGERTHLNARSSEILENQPIFQITKFSCSILRNILFSYQTSLIVCELKQTNKDAQSLLNFRESLWNAYKNKLNGECTIQVEGTEFKVSKMIFAAQSEVFERMFSMNNTKESQTGIVKIQDVNANVMEALIEFLHLGVVENFDEIADKLFIVADKYAILDLKIKCANSLGASLNKENFFDHLVLAFKYSSDELKNHIVDFLSKRTDEIFMSLLTSEQWIEFRANNEELAKEIVETIGKR